MATYVASKKSSAFVAPPVGGVGHYPGEVQPYPGYYEDVELLVGLGKAALVLFIILVVLAIVLMIVLACVYCFRHGGRRGGGGGGIYPRRRRGSSPEENFAGKQSNQRY